MSDAARHAGGIALIFPGQGAQYVGMGEDVYRASADARSLYDQADAVLGYALSEICFQGPDEAQRPTRVQQPAILVTSLAYLAARGYVVSGHARDDVRVATGHSLGLYTALVVAGVLDFSAAVRLVARRGELMQEAADRLPGAMSAVLGLEDSVVEDLCAEAVDGDVVVAANYNCPGQVVVSGSPDGVARAGELARERGARRVVELPVAGAFHSPLMHDAAMAMQRELGGVDLRDAAFPVIANSEPCALHNADEIRRELERQIEAPVRWTAAVRLLETYGVAEVIDSGPGSTVAALAKKILPTTEETRISRLDG